MLFSLGLNLSYFCLDCGWFIHALRIISLYSSLIVELLLSALCACAVNLIVEWSAIPSHLREQSYLIPQLNQIICRLCVKEALGLLYNNKR